VGPSHAHNPGQHGLRIAFTRFLSLFSSLLHWHRPPIGGTCARTKSLKIQTDLPRNPQITGQDRRSTNSCEDGRTATPAAPAAPCKNNGLETGMQKDPLLQSAPPQAPETGGAVDVSRRKLVAPTRGPLRPGSGHRATQIQAPRNSQTSAFYRQGGIQAESRLPPIPWDLNKKHVMERTCSPTTVGSGVISLQPFIAPPPLQPAKQRSGEQSPGDSGGRAWGATGTRLYQSRDKRRKIREREKIEITGICRRGAKTQQCFGACASPGHQYVCPQKPNLTLRIIVDISCRETVRWAISAGAFL